MRVPFEGTITEKRRNHAMFDDKKLAECVYDLTLIANCIITNHKGLGIDSRAVFEVIYGLAYEFEYGKDGNTIYEDNGNYMEDIEEYGWEHLPAFFGIGGMENER